MSKSLMSSSFTPSWAIASSWTLIWADRISRILSLRILHMKVLFQSFPFTCNLTWLRFLSISFRTESGMPSNPGLQHALVQRLVGFRLAGCRDLSRIPDRCLFSLLDLCKTKTDPSLPPPLAFRIDLRGTHNLEIWSLLGPCGSYYHQRFDSLHVEFVGDYGRSLSVLH